MTNTENIFNPQDNSLESRISAYVGVYDAWLNAELSLKFLDDELWSEVLGEREDVEMAYRIASNSLDSATRSITQDEILRAKKQGLVSDDQVSYFIQNKRQQEMKKMRDNTKLSQSSQHSQSL